LEKLDLHAESLPHRLRAQDYRVAGLVFVAVALVYCLRAMHLVIINDEQMYTAAGVVTWREGWLPYFDYPFFQTPMMIGLAAAAEALTDDPMMTLRWVNCLCAATIIVLIFLETRRLLPRKPAWASWTVCLALGTLLLPNRAFRLATGAAWTFDIPALLAVASLIWMIHRTRHGVLLRSALIGGLLIGLAAAIRLTLAPLWLAVVLPIWLRPDGHWKTSLQATAALLAGTLIATAPAWALFLADPVLFWFNNITYHNDLDVVFHLASGDPQPLFPLWKLEYMATLLRWQPIMRISLLLVCCSGLLMLLQRRPVLSYRPLVVMLVAMAIAWASLMPPSPFWPHHMHTLAALATLGLVYAVAPWLNRPRALCWAAVGLIVIGLATLPSLSRRWYTWQSYLQIVDYSPHRTHRIAGQLDLLLPDDQKVLTLAPMAVFESGGKVYPWTITGPFTMLRGSFMPADPAFRRDMRMVGDDELDAVLATDPPDAVLLGMERPQFEQRMIDWTQASGMIPIELDHRVTLWVWPERFDRSTGKVASAAEP
jgi:hypothetical protein